jgi:hypothetical protein
VCRYTHGTLCIFHAPLPGGVAPRFVAPSRLEDLTAYANGEAKSTRYFCSTCGCHIGDVCPDDGGWVISSSIFDTSKTDEKAFELRTHVFAKSARDGGLVNWLPRVGDRPMRFWEPDPADEPNASDVVEQQAETGPDGEDRLRAQCHCGGVSFTIPRPTTAVAAHERFKKYISPVDPTMWAACTDLCDDCRLVDGTHVVAWTFVPRSLLLPPVGADLLIGTSKTYASSEGVLRSFCGVCGATVFFSCDERKEPDGVDDQVLDITVGILRAPEGPLAEKWITWRTGRSAWQESGKRFDGEFANSLVEGMAAWGKEKYGEALNFTIG